MPDRVGPCRALCQTVPCQSSPCRRVGLTLERPCDQHHVQKVCIVCWGRISDRNCKEILWENVTVLFDNAPLIAVAAEKDMNIFIEWLRHAADPKLAPRPGFLNLFGHFGPLLRKIKLTFDGASIRAIRNFRRWAG